MTTRQIVFCVVAALVVAALFAFACHGLGLDSHGFAFFPLAAGALTFLYARRRFRRGGL